MTNVITRYFESATQARLVRRELINRRRFSPRIVHLHETTVDLEDALTAAQAEAATAKAYQKQMASGGAVMVVYAGYKPLSVAQTTRDVTAAMGAMDFGDLVEEVYVHDKPTLNKSILSGHPHMMSRPLDRHATDFYMANWPIPLISRRKPFKETLFDPPHSHMANWPIPLLSDRKPYTKTAIGRHARMANFPIPLLSDRKPYNETAIGRHTRMANFPIPLISRRKPFKRSIFPRHARMATVPFPLLINGKSRNSLMPGGPRMANFPISLLSNRKPNTATAIGRHTRMANFPIPLISRRKPFTGSIFPRHARMADTILPLVTKRRETPAPDGPPGFSLSRMLGLATVVRR